MSLKSKFWGLCTLSAVLIAALVFIFNVGGTREKAWLLIKPEFTAENVELKIENQRLKHSIAHLKKQNRNLKTYLDAYEENIIALKDAAKNCDPFQTMLQIDLPAGLATERFEIRQLYRQKLAEKKRWDQYQQNKYRGILEDTLEPAVVEAQNLVLDNEDNLDHFLELDGALKLHRRLIRDVRIFHDEIKYQKKQFQAQQPYALYDVKFSLAPFTRESALVDALQQAMSALSTGIYEQEAIEVLDRISDEFTEPIQRLYEHQLDGSDPVLPLEYNYNFYTLFGKKLMDYADKLAGQSAIPLGPSAFGELDFFNRQLLESLADLYEVGQTADIHPHYLDVSELEHLLTSRP